MRKAVLISIQPKWCELIASGKKTVEVRKSRPKLETPFKVYIYCTLQGSNEFFKNTLNGNISEWNKGNWRFKKGKVIGEFVCDCIISHCEMANADIAEQQGRIKREELFEYSNGKELFGWHISDLKIYNKPKELSEFSPSDCGKKRCFTCKCFDPEKPSCTLKRPPQSWCYVEESEENA